MNLEAAEQRVLAYLKQVSNPLVRFSTLLNYVREDEQFAHLDERQFLEFLRHHELFSVLDPASFSEGLGSALTDVGLLHERAVILSTRIPTPGQVTELMEAQLQLLADALVSAYREAQERGDEVGQERIKRVLQRTDLLRQKIRQTTP
jgi:hypothetical protein